MILVKLSYSLPAKAGIQTQMLTLKKTVETK